MKLKDIIKNIELFAPLSLQESYDNSGLMVGDEEKEIKKVLLALDCTNDVISEAKKNKVDLIITHHPLLFVKPKRIVKSDLTGGKIYNLIESGICLYSSHTNLDAAKGGLNETIMEILGYTNSKIIDVNKNNIEAGIGRIVKLEQEVSLNDIIKNVRLRLNVPSLRVVDSGKKINSIAVINGSGSSFFDIASKLGADCIITGDTTYHYASDYKEIGISIIDPGHFFTEWIVFIYTMKKILKQFNDLDILVSVESRDPYEYL